LALSIRPETPADRAAVHAVHALAFETDAEARLVDALRAAGRLTLSLVAEAESGDGPIGHIAFSLVALTGPDGATIDGVGLAPVAVLPAHQRRGVGGRLVEEGLRRLREAGHGFCVVLGHPGYYPRFGFLPARLFGVRWEREVTDGVFLALELRPGALVGHPGVVRYAPEFDGIWRDPPPPGSAPRPGSPGGGFGSGDVL